MASRLSGRVRSVASLFVSFAVVQSVLACAIWPFERRDNSDNLLYGGCVLATFLLHCGIAGSLLLGCHRHSPALLSPFIVCSSMYFVVSVVASIYFMICTIYGIVLGNDLVEVYGLLTFLALSYFFGWSWNEMSEERGEVSRLAGKHFPFSNEEEFI